MVVGLFTILPLASLAGADHYRACLVFLITGFLVFGTSSAYHLMHDGFEISFRLAGLLEDLDHFSIYLFIAGTYSPMILCAVKEPWRTPLLVAIWSIALLGILYTWLKPHLPKVLQGRFLSTGLFVAMGWVLVVRLGEVASWLSLEQASYLMGGVLSYSGGAVVYARQKPKLWEGLFGYHELWHLTVLIGAASHFLLVRSFYL